MNLTQYDNKNLGLGDIRSIILDFFKELETIGKFNKNHPGTIIQAANNAIRQYKKDNNQIGVELYQCQYCKKLYEDNLSCKNCSTINSKIVIKEDKTEVWIWNREYETWEYDLTL